MTTLAALIAKLRGVQAENLIPTGLTGDDEARANAALANREDRAYAAVARCPATNLAEMHQKLLIMLEGHELIKRGATGHWGGASIREQKLLVKSLLADAERLCRPAPAALKRAA